MYEITYIIVFCNLIVILIVWFALYLRFFIFSSIHIWYVSYCTCSACYCRFTSPVITLSSWIICSSPTSFELFDTSFVSVHLIIRSIFLNWTICFLPLHLILHLNCLPASLNRCILMSPVEFWCFLCVWHLRILSVKYCKNILIFSQSVCFLIKTFYRWFDWYKY